MLRPVRVIAGSPLREAWNSGGSGSGGLYDSREPRRTWRGVFYRMRRGACFRGDPRRAAAGRDMFLGPFAWSVRSWTDA